MALTIQYFDIYLLNALLLYKQNIDIQTLSYYFHGEKYLGWNYSNNTDDFQHFFCNHVNSDCNCFELPIKLKIPYGK